MTSRGIVATEEWQNFARSWSSPVSLVVKSIATFNQQVAHPASGNVHPQLPQFITNAC
jgi:hypothetical protein